MFNHELFICEMPLLGGVIAVVFLFFLVFGAIGAISDGGNPRFLLAGLAMTAIIGVIGLLCIAGEAWQITRDLVENYVTWFGFNDNFWGRMGIIAVLGIPAVIAGTPLCLIESRLLNWAARG